MVQWGRVFERLKGAVGELRPVARKAALERLIEWAEYEIGLAETEIELDREIPPVTRREVIQGSRRRQGRMTVQQEYVKCGKATCRNDRHGPYWYGYLWENGKQKSVYLGKDLAPGLQRKGLENEVHAE